MQCNKITQINVLFVLVNRRLFLKGSPTHSCTHSPMISSDPSFSSFLCQGLDCSNRKGSPLEQSAVLHAPGMPLSFFSFAPFLLTWLCCSILITFVLMIVQCLSMVPWNAGQAGLLHDKNLLDASCSISHPSHIPLSPPAPNLAAKEAFTYPITKAWVILLHFVVTVDLPHPDLLKPVYWSRYFPECYF